MDDLSYSKHERDNNHFQSARPDSIISFGAANTSPAEVSESAPFGNENGHDKFSGSLISIRDIQEVRDKVPASPATKLNEPIPYFQ